MLPQQQHGQGMGCPWAGGANGHELSMDMGGLTLPIVGGDGGREWGGLGSTLLAGKVPRIQSSSMSGRHIVLVVAPGTHMG